MIFALYILVNPHVVAYVIKHGLKMDQDHHLTPTTSGDYKHVTATCSCGKVKTQRMFLGRTIAYLEIVRAEKRRNG